MAYRRDIDGLRAFAILGVALFHFGVEDLPGGYAGVDVFFVISGFVITRLLISELQSDTFRFGQFYRRRIFRILPALLTTVVLTTLAMFLLASPDRLEDYARSAAAAVLSVSNLVFWSEAGYFDAAAQAKPLLHTWSLGVEEQFYLVWPPLLVWLWRAGDGGALKPIIVVGGAVSGLSFVAGVLLLPAVPDAVFYWMPFRIFEFALGAALVVLPALPAGWYREAALTTGLAAIVATYVLFDEHTPFPGAAALLPSVGAALALAGGQAVHTGWILRNPLAVFFGRISYSLYLVHWPLVYFYLDLLGPIKWRGTLLLLVAATALATAMHYAIETPFRRWGRESAGRGATWGTRAIAAAAIAVVVVSGLAANGLATPLDILGRRLMFSPDRIAAEKSKRYSVRKEQCRRTQCDLVVPGKFNVLIVGDSTAPDALNAMSYRFPGFNYIMSTLGGCPPHPAIETIITPRHPNYSGCMDLNAKRFDPAALEGMDAIVISVVSTWFTPELLEPYLDFVRERSHAKIIVFGSYVALTRDMTDILQSANYAGSASIEANVKSKFGGEEKFKALAAKHRYLFVSKKDVFCQPSCLYVDADGIPFSWDTTHLSLEFARRFGAAIERDVRAFLETK